MVRGARRRPSRTPHGEERAQRASRTMGGRRSCPWPVLRDGAARLLRTRSVRGVGMAIEGSRRNPAKCASLRNNNEAKTEPRMGARAVCLLVALATAVIAASAHAQTLTDRPIGL